MAGADQIIYNLDTSALITLEAFYPADVFPPVWDKLDELLGNKRAYFIEEVYIEVQRRDDAVAQWLKRRRSYGMKNQTQDDFLQAQGVISNHPGLVDINATQTGADPFVIADSIRCGSVVVTREEKVGVGAKRPKIPNVCEAYKVRCIHGQYYATEFFRENGWTFT